MDQLMEYAKKLTKYDASGKIIRSGLSLRLVGGGSGLAEKFWILMMENGGSIVQEVSPEKYKAGYDNEAGLKTLQMYVDMLYKYKTCDFDIKADAEGFEMEKTAMFARETWVIADIKAKAPQLEYFTAPMPGDANIGNAYDFFV
jgi:multiple sugar transport system substrate-binding protein